MGLFGGLFGGGSSDGSMPGYLRDKVGDTDSLGNYSPPRPAGKRWVCPRCGTTNPGNYGRCHECGNYNPNDED